MTAPAYENLMALLAARGHERYEGERVTHLEHALQCATLAKRARASDALVVAALLHDVGHLLSGLAGTPSAEGVDDSHEHAGADALAAIFGPEVAQPVRWHVAAKRYLAADAVYLRVLSEDSRRSLALQGGPMGAEERERFLLQPFAADAIRLRRWDDGGKSARLATPGLEHFRATVMRVAGSGS